jgi:maltose-binding protein MalE
MFNYKGKLVFGYPYALMNFLTIYNQDTCKEQEANLMEQIKYARCITNTSLKEHTIFFNTMYDNLNHVLSIIKDDLSKPPLFNI